MYTLSWEDYERLSAALVLKFNMSEGKEKAEVEGLWNVIKEEEEQLYG